MFQRIFGKEVKQFGNEAGADESSFEVIAFEVDIGIDFVSDAIASLVAFEADIVSGGADPERFAIHGERRFPDT